MNLNIKKGTLVEVDITGIAFGGRGLARLNGLAVFVSQAVPGDRAVIRITRKKKNFAEGRVVEFVETSPHRIIPPCEYSGYCGGCTWQFLTYDQQLIYKQRQVSDCIEHIGLIKGVPVHQTIPSEAIFGYRNKMEFSCSDKRWLMPSELNMPDIDRSFALGLHVPGTFHKVMDTRSCLLQPELGNELLGDVRKFMQTSEAPVYGLRSHVGFWRFLVLRHSSAYDQWMVNIVTAANQPELVQPLADRLSEHYHQVVSVMNNVTSRKAGIAVGEFEHTLAGSSCIFDKIGRFEFEISANSFFQTNSIGAQTLFNIVENYAGLTGGEIVLDLYSGTGTIPILLSESCKQIIGIEIVGSAIADAEKNCRKNNISNCEFIHGDIRRCLSQVEKQPDVLIIDPPRAGMHKDVVNEVLDSNAERIIYVSCNPATLARDLSVLQAGYSILEVQPVDMFPHTYHVEAVTRLVKR